MSKKTNRTDRIGVIVSLESGVGDAIGMVRRLGLRICQVSCWKPRLLTKETAAALRRETASGVRVVALWAGYSGPQEWNFIRGPSTIGLVPDRWREGRLEELKAAARFAADCGIRAIATHVGFLPEDPADPKYRPTVWAVRKVARLCYKLGLQFWFETGQETPVTLLRLIEDVGLDNLGVNLDPANLVMYGKANPVDALDVIGRYVRCVHAKDGLYPSNGRSLGRETPLGKGKVDWPALVRKLHTLRFRGPYIIEREMSGPQQMRDIRRARRMLEPLIAETAFHRA